MSFRGRKTFVSHSEIAILADDLPYSKRLPRLRESLAEPTRGAAQSQRSEVVFNSTRDLLPSSDSLDYANRWRSPYAEPPSHSDRKSCSTRREISSRGRGYGCPNIADIVTPSVATPSITRIAGGAHMRSRPVTAIGSRVQLDAISPPEVVDMGARTSPI
ncbi:hypothetical protein Taro_055129 [Colocasia esculenta]|uniref:Uncharacterized protein n=1 Tax=Colocasia esculenta TaxID=4460 RepID=A0A843XSN3_COLES|nr:hypothetical protein [Colocasia esculenta]